MACTCEEGAWQVFGRNQQKAPLALRAPLSPNGAPALRATQPVSWRRHLLGAGGREPAPFPSGRARRRRLGWPPRRAGVCEPPWQRTPATALQHVLRKLFVRQPMLEPTRFAHEVSAIPSRRTRCSRPVRRARPQMATRRSEQAAHGRSENSWNAHEVVQESLSWHRM